MALTYDEEKKLGAVRQQLVRWFDRMAELAEDHESKLPSLSIDESRAMRAGADLYKCLIGEVDAGKDHAPVINLADVSTEQLREMASQAQDQDF